MDRVSLFRNVTRWDGWRQFDSPRHEADTRDADKFDVREFVPEADARAEWEATWMAERETERAVQDELGAELRSALTQLDTLRKGLQGEVEDLRGIAASKQLITPANALILGWADRLQALLDSGRGMSGERDWKLCFEQWPGAGRFHVRRPDSFGEGRQPFFCGMYMAAEGPIRFEDELEERDMCKTCRKRALAQAESELTAPPSSGSK